MVTSTSFSLIFIHNIIIGTELQSRGVPESEPEVTIEESNTHIDVLSVERSLMTSPQNKQISSSTNYGTIRLSPQPTSTNILQETVRYSWASIIIVS